MEKWWENNFWQKVEADSVYTLWVKNVVEITLSHTVSEIIYLFIYFAFNTVQVISRRVVGRAEETSTYSLLGFCTVNRQKWGGNDFWKKSPLDFADTLWVKNFVKIALAPFLR